MKRCVAVWLAGLLLAGAARPVLAETILGKIGRTGVLTAGTRGIAIPFAFINEKNEWIGFSIDLLEAIRIRLERRLGKPIKLEKKEVGGDPAIRIGLVANRTIDVECGVTTYSRSRDQTVDFSIPFFFTGAQLLVKRGSGIKSLTDVAGKRVGAAEGTTNEKALRAAQPKADVVTFKDHPPGFLALEQGGSWPTSPMASSWPGWSPKPRTPSTTRWWGISSRRIPIPAWSLRTTRSGATS
jgi:polar amino acid transport system substrate-binding protein